MTDDANKHQIAGEPRELLRQAVACFAVTVDSGGAAILSGKLPQKLAEPFTRALMRTEAELLLHDADLFTSTIGETRTQSERRADALEAMILRLVD